MIQARLALYGGGKMGFAMLKGWLASGVSPKNIAVFDPSPSQDVKDAHVHINPDKFDADVVILAVKPQIMPDLLKSTEFPKHSMIVSVAAGIPLAQYEKTFGKQTRIVRAMPNTPSAVGAGITAIVGNKAVKPSDLDMAEGLLKAVGDVVRLDDEKQMDVVTGLSGSGPAYVFYMIEAMREAGEAEGLSPEISRKLALATVSGAGLLAQRSGVDASELRQNVTSPGGTTQAGLEVLMDKKTGLAPLMQKTVRQAAERSRELGKS